MLYKKVTSHSVWGRWNNADYFVPIDTTQYSDYHRNLVARGVIIRTTMKYIEGHRKELQQKYTKFETFKSNFEIGDDILSEMKELADKEKIVFDKKQYEALYR